MSDTRRSACTLAALTACVAVLVPAPEAAAGSSTCGPTNLVQKAGAVFKCGNKPFRFVGVNSRDLVYLYNRVLNANNYNGPAAARVVYEQLQAIEAMGATVVRVYLPREEKAPSDFPSLAEYHTYFHKQLRYLLDFATLPGPFTADEGIDDYRKYRSDDMAAAPAPGLKFLVVLTDSIYACDRKPWGNLVLRNDIGAFTGSGACPPGGPNLDYFSTDWFRAAGTPVNYTQFYKPFVRSVASAFYGDARLFGFELVNEGRAASAGDVRAFLEDVICAVKGHSCANRRERELSAQDRNRLVGTGFITTWHAAGCTPSNAGCAATAQATLHGRGSPIDFGSIHQYNDANGEHQDDDFTFFRGHTPYVVGEIGYTYGGTGTSRGADVHAGLARTFEASQANGVLQWAFYGSTNADGAALLTDGSGLDQFKDDWPELFAEYRCRALRLDNENANRRGIDIALGYLDWSNLSRPNAPDVAVGEQVRFHFRVCNVGTDPATLGQGVSLFLSNNTPTPPPLVPIGTGVFAAGTLAPGDLITIDSDWTVVDPGTLDPAITLDNAVVVGLADDVNRYPNEITEANNGYSIDFPILPCPGTPVSQRQLCCLPVAVVNPSFEEPVISPPWARFNSIPGWEGPIDIHREPDLPASDGFQVADLNQNSFGYVRQVIETVPGETYTVRWAQGVNYHCIGSASLSVDIDGVSVGSFGSVSTPAYKQATFTAGGTSTELKFRSLTGGCGAATVDDVSVSCR